MPSLEFEKQKTDALSFFGKRVLVMGLGLHGGGLEAVKYLLKNGARVLVTDKRTEKELRPSIAVLGSFVRKGAYPRIRYVLGHHREKDFSSVDFVLKNAGVRPDSPYLEKARKRGTCVISDITMFFDVCPAPIIGVTGTRGKSTAAYLISEFLHAGLAKKRVWLGGNIRRSVLEFLPSVRRDDVVVLELSSFQLMDLEESKKSPQISVMTNIMNDHLNWHRSRREYIRAKSVIFRYQSSKDHLFVNSRDPILRRATTSARSRTHFVKIPKAYERLVEEKLGVHYSASVGLAIAVARHFGIRDRTIKSVLLNFTCLSARQEEIRVWKGIHFVNDTTATIPDAAVAALKRFSVISGKRGGEVVLIAGGSDKKLDFRAFIKSADRFAKAIIFLPGDATLQMKRELGRVWSHGPARADGPHTRDARSMREAVRFAVRAAAPGDTVLLSPGAASFGLFVNEFDRGDQFTREVKRL
ncbi:MAG: UDP-N-acetylmuramoyl-L-alanine--D-glutamate ligase [Patescibacteria group bacterium]